MHKSEWQLIYHLYHNELKLSQSKVLQRQLTIKRPNYRILYPLSWFLADFIARKTPPPAMAMSQLDATLYEVDASI
jgi:hypothetical protein